MNNDGVIGLDIAKNIFHLYTIGSDGKTCKRKLKRAELLAFFANYPGSLIGILAYWHRSVWRFASLG